MRPFSRVALSALMIMTMIGCSGSDNSDTRKQDTVNRQDDTLQAQDTLPMEVELVVEAPADNSVVSSSPVLVTGIVDGPESGRVFINDLEAQVTGNRFSLLVPLNQNSNTLVVRHEPSGETVTLTITLDSLPPVLNILTPDRGKVLEGPADSIELTAQTMDEEGISSILVNGLSLEPVTDIKTEVALTPGLNHLVVEVTDSTGNLSREHRTLMAGPFMDCKELQSNPVAMLTLGLAALDTIGDIVSGVVEGLDIEAMLEENNPVFSYNGLDVYITTLVPQGLALDFIPSDGVLNAVATIESVEISGHVLVASSGTMALLFTAELENGDVELGLALDVIDGLLTVEPEDVQVAAGAINLVVTDEDGFEVVAPTEISGNFLEMLGQTIADMAAEGLADALKPASLFSKGAWELDIMGVPLGIVYEMLDIAITDSAVGLMLGGKVEIGSGGVHNWNHGCFTGSLELPTATGFEGAELFIAYPFINNLVVSLWESGFMDFRVDQELMEEMKTEVTLVCGMLGNLFPLATGTDNPESPMVVELSPGLPPLVTPGKDGNEQINLDLGSLYVDILCGASTKPVAVATLALVADMGFDVTESRLKPAIRLDKFLVDLDGLEPDAKRIAEKGTETGLEATLTDMLPLLLDSLVEVPLPSLLGFSLSDGFAGNSPEAGWFVVRGMLESTGE